MNLRRMLLVVVLLVGVALGQSFRGGILGTITDASGASVAGAKVTATNTETGLVRDSITDTDGNYSFSELQLGNYSITATKEGFRTQTATNIVVAVEGPQRANLTMTPGRVDERVEVQADVPLVETSSNTLGGTIQAEDFKDLPVNGRDFMKMLTAVPGANADPSSVNDSPGSFGVFSVNGNRGRSNNFLLDGTDMNDGFRNDNAINEGGVFGIPATLLPIDAVQEMAILNNTEAEFGRNSGSIVNIVTKSGTNSLHGSAFEYFRNNALDARNYFNCAQTQCASNVAGGPQNAFHNNQFGGSLGGPIIRDKTFFLFSYEGQRERVGFPSPATIPSQALIAQDAPLTGINPIIQNILNTNPWGPLPAVGNDPQGLTYTEEVNAPSSNRLDSLIAKIDQHIGQNDLLTGRYYFGDSSQSAPLAIVGGDVLPGFNTVVPTRVQVVSLSYTHVITPRLLSEIRGGWNRFAESFSAQDSSLNPASLGLNTANSDFTSADYGLPVINVGGFAGMGSSKSVPRGRVDSNVHYLSNFAYNRGAHNWKFGYEFRRTTVNQYFDLNHRGTLDFSSLSDFLAGNITGGGSQTAGSSHRHTYQNSFAFYLQDNFRVSHRLTLNYGLRWDYYGVIGEKNDLFSILNSSYNLVEVGTSGAPSSLYPKDYHNFSPRIGVAYDAFGTGKTVFRLGYGFAYDAFSQDFFAGQIPYVSSNAGPLFNDVGPSPISYGSPAANVLQPEACGGYEVIPVPNSSLCTGPIFGGFGPVDVFTVDQRLRTPYVQNYNLNIEQQVNSKTAISIAYVGSSGRKLFRFIDLNQGDPATGVRPLSALGLPYGYVLDFQSSAISNYNSLQMRLNVRNLHGFTSTANYTFSHSIDTASDGQDYTPFQAQPQNSFNPRGDRSNSGFDVRQRFSWLWDYRIPEAHSMHLVTGGWSISGVVSLATGMPFSVLDYDNFNNTGEFYERPDLVGNPFAGSSGPANYLNLSAFAASCNWNASDGGCDPNTPNYHFGSSARNGLYGPHYRNFDFSLNKETKLTERVSMQLRADFFNLFNHPNFANPVLPSFNVLWTQNGINSNTGQGMNFFPLTVTPDVGAQNPFLGGGGPRDIQVSARFSF
ncbi:MAG TPA: TonB-dependent receptor [Terriglobales bacterium]|jgi:outer membrane receptor protein involved in Fe transport|nr:TonB-dependent receptor [Terriglobales bacterium]